MRSIITALLVLGAAFTSACGGGAVEETEACTLDVNKLSGQWLVARAHPELGNYTDKYFRVEFKEKEGKQIAIATRGPAEPVGASPLTHKFEYEFARVDDRGEALYIQDLLKDLTPEEMEKVKQQDFFNDPNRRPSGHKLYVKVDSTRCRVRISDMNFYWNKGTENEDSNPAGTQPYEKADKVYSMEDCPELLWVKPMADGKELPPLAEVEAGKPVSFQMLSKVEDDKSEGCELSGEVWLRDLKTDTAVTVETKGKENVWTFDLAVPMEEKPEWEPKARAAFVELYRFKTCDGKKELIRVECNGVTPKAAAAE